MEPPIQVTLAANAGVLLRVRNTSILIDALFADTSGCGLSPETRERLMSDLPPFDEVDYVLFTHLHEDHFSEDMTRTFLRRHTVKGLMLPVSERLERQGFFDFVRETGTPCSVLSGQIVKTVFTLSDEVQVSAFRTLHLDEKYHYVLHFCYLIVFFSWGRAAAGRLCQPPVLQRSSAQAFLSRHAAGGDDRRVSSAVSGGKRGTAPTDVFPEPPCLAGERTARHCTRPGTSNNYAVIRQIARQKAGSLPYGAIVHNVSVIFSPQTKSEDPRESSGLERKKDSADVQFPRLLRKPRKRNGAEFF